MSDVYYDVLPNPTDPFCTISADGHEHWADMNKGVTPIFFMEPVKNPAKSLEAGRAIYDEIECIRLKVAGDSFNEHVAPVDDTYRERFAEAYAKWKQNPEAEHVVGTPLAHWPVMTRALVMEMRALNIFSVEGLAAVADTNLQKHHGLREWRDKAVAWLESAKGGAFAAELVEKNKNLESQMRDLMESNAAMQSRLSELVARLDDEKPKRGGKGE